MSFEIHTFFQKEISFTPNQEIMSLVIEWSDYRQVDCCDIKRILLPDVYQMLD